MKLLSLLCQSDSFLEILMKYKRKNIPQILAKQPWQSARGRGHGNMRGGQGAQGGSFAGRGQATMRGGRGGQQGNPHSYNQQQPTASNRGGRGRTRVSPGGKRQNQSWGQNYPYYESQTNQTFPAGSYGENDDVSIEWNSGRHGEGYEHVHLTVANFQKTKTI